MRVIACPSDRSAVGFYRLGLVAQTLIEQDAGIDFTFLPGLPLNTTLNNQPIGLAKQFFDLEPDVLILQRPMAEWQLIGARAAQARGVAVVIELDDDFHTIDKRSMAGRQITSAHLRILGDCCKLADLVTVSTPALAERYAPHGRFVVLPNFVPESWLEIDSQDSKDSKDSGISRIIGWTGAVATHRDDLSATSGGVGMALAEVDGTFRAYGDGNRDATIDGATVEGYSRDFIRRTIHLHRQPDIQPYQSRADYPHALARLDIGIAPLADTAFNRSKSWLKPLEYAACGVPCVMSPSAEYQRLHDDHGIGILAGPRSREWKRPLMALLQDESHRHEVGQQARQAVRDGLTMEANAWRWVEAWTEAITSEPARKIRPWRGGQTHHAPAAENCSTAARAHCQ